MNKFFEDTADSLPILLLRAREALIGKIRPKLTELDLTEQQWRVLRVLRETGPREPTDLGEACMLLTPSMTRILAALTKRALVRRENHPSDKRKQIIHLTDTGSAMLDQLAPLAEEVYAELEANFGRPQLNNLLNKLRKISEL